jgi:WD40 repeat protein
VGDSNGNITFLKLTDSGCEFKATLNGHEGSIQSLAWDSNRKFLFSGSNDKTIICWDIGGQKGITYDLEAHKDRVQSIIFVPLSRQLVSGSEDNKIVIHVLYYNLKNYNFIHENNT